MPFTFHTHSGQFCRHASGDLESVVVAAIDKGMLAIGLSEHVPRSRESELYPEESDMTPADLQRAFEAYVVEARRLRDRYSGQISILIGAETEYITRSSLEEVRVLREKYRLEYLVGSVHHIDGHPLDFSASQYRQLVDEHFGGDRAAMFRRYFDQQLEMLQALQPEVIGHFDLVRIFHPYAEGVADPLEEEVAGVRELASRNIDYGISYGALFEVNTRAWKKGLRDAYPGRSLLEEIVGKGGRVTISDDSHGAGDVGMYYGRLREYLERAGVHELHYLERAEEGVQVRVLERATEHEFWGGANKHGLE
ncbi:hypothetical protein GGI04_002889 [Coemansia thaxteri]|uniref:Histidinol-phosphatase n=1 Tax=Coemansia thaxteri TaxID=2663907 RepID=A0A9W8BGL2_9FUNG|nr:hypothetical protein H4R26_004696 [Coemansia thaxteri]KAJ2003653.1 hypothetical protein GGI04_002889 [Coemansia thaxteri]KAJ2467280.1 hypothetical protein GGI02_004089 [Coemansia sp. RSA 2322]KAJ2486639.1 hypothetical protein EV174_001012 [Coemansia sp. RSA 2320]